MKKDISNVSIMWQENLINSGYENKINSKRELMRLGKLSRTWKIVMKEIKLKPGKSIFEVGCGGGNQLIPLALSGYKCCGIDCSKEVIDRCKHFISDAEKYSKKVLPVELINEDFLNFNSSNKYDVVFNFGVAEHFLDDAERSIVIKKMFDLCKKGGYVISVVPNGIHPLREKMKLKGLGGYVIPEIDYNCMSIRNEMLRIGAEYVKVIPHNLFGYLLLEPYISILQKVTNHFVYYFAQLLPRYCIPFMCKHALTLICIGRK